MSDSQDKKLGPSGKYPDGKLHPTDRGEIILEIGCLETNGLIIINFGCAVNFVAMKPHEAVNIGETLIERAKEMQS